MLHHNNSNISASKEQDTFTIDPLEWNGKNSYNRAPPNGRQSMNEQYDLVNERRRSPSIQKFFQRMRQFLISKEMTDVHFIFNKGETNETRVAAHKLVLCSASEVFEKQFFYDGQVEVTNSTFDLETFKIVLNFIYSGYEDTSGITTESVWSVLFAGKYYMLEELEKFCVKFLAANLDERSVLTALDKCLKYEISVKLLESCQHYIQKRTRYFLKQWESLSVSYDCLIFLLEQEELNALEVFNWAKKACISANCLPTPENIREKMGTCALKLIRFGEMDEDDFCSVVVPTMLLNKEEKVKALADQDRAAFPTRAHFIQKRRCQARDGHGFLFQNHRRAPMKNCHKCSALVHRNSPICPECHGRQNSRKMKCVPEKK